jgi:xanthine dehydrogenase large subunit
MERLVARFDCEASAVRFAANQVFVKDQVLSFDEVVADAYTARVQLWSDGFYATPGLHWDMKAMQGRPFFYFAYGAAVSEVIIDTLTGESRLLRTDILHDVGRSLNPAVDIGQIEGAFIQSMGWMTSEELCWHPDSGKLLTHSPSTYKIPTAYDCPPDLRVRLYQDDNVADTIYRSKAVGEPPYLLAFSVFLAIRDAIASLADDKVDPPLTVPATPEAILRAVQAVRSPSP